MELWRIMDFFYFMNSYQVKFVINFTQSEENKQAPYKRREELLIIIWKDLC